ncbi:MAG: DUF1223 domain-containing protein [Bdellovibrionales bacterium]|nr:DUF1223 domain-containing protein [Massilia sp.]
MKATNLLVTAGFCVSSASYAANGCDVKSGAATAALVELYTSEGCSSCPPADRALGQLRRMLAPDAVAVPLALHVTYWDRIGWKDVFAQKTFDARQAQLLDSGRRKVAYTPQFFVNGSELRDWSGDLPAAVRRTNAIPAPLTITLKTSFAGGGTLLLEAAVSARDPRTSGQLYVALSESALVSTVLRGENQGLTLRHDDTARLWLGPFSLERGSALMRQQVLLPAGWQRERLQALAFVQAPDARILQAVSTAQCQSLAGL